MSGARQLAAAIKNPFLKLGRAYNATAQKRPCLTGIVTTAFKTSAADAFAQKVIEGRDEMDWRRHGMFCSFGLFYLGGFQYWLYNHAFTRLTPTIQAVFGSRGIAPVKTFIDQGIHHPLAYFPCFYSLKGMVEGRPLEESMRMYREDLWDNLKALWMLWVPAQMINFSVVPPHLRIPYVAGVSFAWTVIISCMRGAMDKRSVAVPATELQQQQQLQQAGELAVGGAIRALDLPSPLHAPAHGHGHGGALSAALSALQHLPSHASVAADALPPPQQQQQEDCYSHSHAHAYGSPLARGYAPQLGATSYASDSGAGLKALVRNM